MRILVTAVLVAVPAFGGTPEARCTPEAWLAPSADFCPTNPFAPPWSCTLPRECQPCRVETTHDGQTTPVQVETYSYDAGGRLLRSESRIGETVTVVTCAYDRGGLARCSHGGTPSLVTFERGRMTKWTEADFVTTYEYDAAGRLKRVDVRIEGEPSSTTTWEYGRNGRIEWKSDEPGVGLAMQYDETGRFIGAKRVEKPGSSRWETRVTWEEAGRKAVLDDGMLVYTWEFGKDGRLVSTRFHPKAGIISASGTTRYVYACTDATDPSR